jgi:HEXXH motif-containing protein
MARGVALPEDKGGSRPASLPEDFLQAKVRGFSCPQEGLDETFLELLCIKHAHQTVQLFLERFHEELDKRGRGVVELLERWLSGAKDFDTVWHPAFEHAWAAIRAGGASAALEAGAALSLRLGEVGLSGKWSLTLDTPAELRWSHWPLPVADRVGVSSDGRTANIITALGEAKYESVLTRFAEGWQGSDFEAVQQFGVNRRLTLLSRRMLAGGSFGDLIPVAVPEVDSRTATILQNSLGLLSKHAPIYLPWVERMLRYIILLQLDGEQMRSGSENGQSGFVYISVCPSPMPFAELLVHEATHQYNHLLSRLGRTDDGTDKKLYYSPAVKRERSLDRIVVAYHAFGNLLLLYQLCRGSGVDDNGYCERSEQDLVPYVQQLEAPLRNNRALTAIGRGLCEPLMERLR